MLGLLCGVCVLLCGFFLCAKFFPVSPAGSLEGLCSRQLLRRRFFSAPHYCHFFCSALVASAGRGVVVRVGVLPCCVLHALGVRVPGLHTQQAHLLGLVGYPCKGDPGVRPLAVRVSGFLYPFIPWGSASTFQRNSAYVYDGIYCIACRQRQRRKVCRTLSRSCPSHSLASRTSSLCRSSEVWRVLQQSFR